MLSSPRVFCSLDAGSPLSFASQSSPRKSGPSSTARRAQEASSTPKARLVRQALLAARSSMLVRLETGTPRRHARNRYPLAPRRLPLVLADDFEDQEAIARRQTPKEVRDLSFRFRVRLDVSIPCALRPARNYSRFWIWRSSFERQRDFNPPE